MSESTVDSEITTAQLRTMLEEGDPALTALNARWVDALVRESRNRGWCEDFDIFMARYASAWMRLEREPEDTNRYRLYDSDGYNCRGYDRDGYNVQGIDRGGFDRDGYNSDGHDRDGYDRDGYNSDGHDRDGYDRDGYNARGWDSDGIDRDGYNRDGRLVDHERAALSPRYRFDVKGYDREGFNGHGVVLPYSTRTSLAARQNMPDSAFVYNRNGYTAVAVEAEAGLDALNDDGGATRGCTCHECTEGRRRYRESQSQD